MEAIFIPAVILVGVVIAVFAVIASQQRARELSNTYARLARTFGGRADQGGIFQRPSARFVYQGRHVLLDVYSTGGKHPTYYTQLHIGGIDPGLRAKIYPERLWNAVGKLLGMTDIEVGSPLFDSRYIITGNRQLRLREWLTPHVQQCIERLRGFLGNDDICVELRGGTMLIKKKSHIRQYHQLEQYVRMGLALVDASMEESSEGIEFVSSQDRVLTGDTTCQVCGDPIAANDQNLVFCRSCHTPHHRDCWQYAGICSTYGCGDNHYVMRPPKRRVHR